MGVRIERAYTAIEVEIRDDGRGFDPAARTDGFGVVGMRERVAMYNGDLTAGPRPTGGFRVVARLPFGALA